MLKRSIVIGLLCFAGQAYSAEIAVTTTEDNDVDDKECSLREAIQYINSGMPEAGYHGCGGKDSSSIILLKDKAIYKLKKRLEIKAATTIKTTYDSTEVESTVAGLNNALIQMTEKDQIFHIDNNDKALIIVNLQEVSLQGCKESVCATQGGIIYNNETLQLQSVSLKDGYADQGGAIYNVGTSTEGTSLASTVKIYNTLFENNTATQGAAIYTYAPRLEISSSVFKANTGHAAIFTANAMVDADKQKFPFKTYAIINSTFFKNSGFALNLKDGMALNNVTIVKNGGGVELDVLNQGFVANSIIFSNGAKNCSAEITDKTVFFNNLLGTDCSVGSAENKNELWSGSQSLAGTDEGACKNLIEDQNSLLCPYSVPRNAFLGYLRPRILLSFNDIFSGPILNKGQSVANGNTEFVSCEGNDQRGTDREDDNLWCDRGAIEIAVPTDIPRAGQDIKPGQTAKFNILEYLGDSDLIPKDECNSIVGQHPKGEAWQDGCLLIKQTQTVSKGKTTLNLNGDLEYIPNGAWHGADIFDIQLITSSTRYNTANKYISADVRIYQEPDNTMESKSVKTSGGSLGLFGLAGLLGLMGLRRLKK